MSRFAICARPSAIAGCGNQGAVQSKLAARDGSAAPPWRGKAGYRHSGRVADPSRVACTSGSGGGAPRSTQASSAPSRSTKPGSARPVATSVATPEWLAPWKR